MCQLTGSSVVQIMACHLDGAKPLSELMLTYHQLHFKEDVTMKFYFKFKYLHSKNVFEHVFCEMAAIFLKGRWVKWTDSAMIPFTLNFVAWSSKPWPLQCCHISITMSQITGNLTVCSEVFQSNNKGCIKAPHHWPFVKGIHWWPVDSPHKGPVMWKVFSYHDINMTPNYAYCNQ